MCVWNSFSQDSRKCSYHRKFLCQSVAGVCVICYSQTSLRIHNQLMWPNWQKHYCLLPQGWALCCQVLYRCAHSQLSEGLSEHLPIETWCSGLSQQSELLALSTLSRYSLLSDISLKYWVDIEVWYRMCTTGSHFERCLGWVLPLSGLKAVNQGSLEMVKFCGKLFHNHK